MELPLEHVIKLEIDDMIRYLMHVTNKTHDEVSRSIPGYFYEGCILSDECTDEWCKPIVTYMVLNEIESIEIYQES